MTIVKNLITVYYNWKGNLDNFSHITFKKIFNSYWIMKWSWCDSLRSHDCIPTMLIQPWNFPGKSTGVGCHFLLQGIFPNWGSNPGLWHCRQTLYPLSHQGSLPVLEYNWLTMLWKFQVYRKVIHLYIYMHLFKMITGIMTDKTISRYNVDSKDIVKFKDTVKFLKNFLYNVWHSCIKNVYTYRYNLGNLSISTYLIMLLIWFSFPNKPN